MIAWAKQHLFVVLAAVAVVLAAIVNLGVAGYQATQQAEQDQQLHEVRDERSRATQVVETAQREVTARVFGANHERVDRDTTHLTSLLDTALTWDSHESYVTSRDTLVDEYGLARDSAFMTDFLVSPDEVITVDGEGNEYYGIDARGLNSSTQHVVAELISVHGTEYRYMITGEISVLGEVGSESARASRPILVFATVDGDGEVVDIEGYATTQEIRTAS